jgi:hypothetical protein
MGQPSPIEAVANKIKHKVIAEAMISDIGSTVGSIFYTSGAIDTDAVEKLIVFLKQGSGVADVRQYLQQQMSRYPDHYAVMAEEMGFDYSMIDAYLELKSNLKKLSAILIKLIVEDIERLVATNKEL